MTMLHESKLDCTVIIPAFEIDSKLLRSVNSILRGSTQPKSIHVIHDGGGIDSNILFQLDHPSVKVDLNSHNLGVSARLNEGLNSCETRYIARLDADDVAAPGRFENQINSMVKTGVDFSFGRAISIDLKGRRKFALGRPSLRGEFINPVIFLTGNPIVHPTTMMRTDWVRLIGGYPPFLSEDYGLWLRAGASGAQGLHIDQNFIYRSIHQGQVSKKIPILNSASQLVDDWQKLKAKFFPASYIKDLRTLSQILSVNRLKSDLGWEAADSDFIHFLMDCHRLLKSNQKGQRKWISSQILATCLQRLSA